MGLQKIIIETSPGVPEGADNDVTAAAKINATMDFVEGQQASMDGSLAAAQALAGQATSDADRSELAVSQLSTELAQVQALAAQVSNDKDLVSSTLIGDEDYTIPAVTKLLAQNNVIATAVSDDVWAEHSYQWGGPSKVLVATDGSDVFFYDMTKPSLPIWKTLIGGAPTCAIWSAGDVDLTSLVLAGPYLIVGSRKPESSYGYSGVRILDFANDEGFSYANQFGYGTPNPDMCSKSLANANDEGFFTPAEGSYIVAGDYALISGAVNSVDAYIPDNALGHPVSDIPVSIIAIGTDAGVSVLRPNQAGGYQIVNITASNANYSRVFHVELLDNNRMHIVFGWVSGSDRSFNHIIDIPDADTVLSTTTPNSSLNGAFYGRANMINANMSIAGPRTGTSAKTWSHWSKHLISGESGLTVVKENPSDPSKGMIAHITENYSTPFMVGDTHCALMCDGEEGVITGDNLLEPLSDLAQFLPSRGKGELFSLVDGSLRVTCPINSTFGVAVKLENLVVGDAYSSTILATNIDADSLRFRVTVDQSLSFTVFDSDWSVNITDELFIAAAETMYVGVIAVVSESNKSFDLDEISINRALLDSSGKNNHAIINGSLTRAKPVGSDIAVWSGFDHSGKNIEYPDSKSLFPHDTDWSFTFATDSASDFVLGQRGKDAVWNTVGRAGFQIHVSGGLGAKQISTRFYSNEGQIASVSNIVWPENNDDKAVTINKVGASLSVYLNRQRIGFIDTGWDQDVGVVYDNLKISHGAGGFSQFVYSGAALNPDQIRDLHRDVLNKLSKPSMLSAPVKALAHDSNRSQDWIATSEHKLHRLEGTYFVETIGIDASIGNVSSLTVDDGNIIVAGDTDVSVNLRAKNLRETKVISASKTHSFELGEGDTTTTDFYLQYGWKPIRVFVNGVKQRKGTQDDFTIEFDGYRHFVRFTTAPGIFDIDVDVQESK